MRMELVLQEFCPKLKYWTNLFSLPTRHKKVFSYLKMMLLIQATCNGDNSEKGSQVDDDDEDDDS